MHEMLDARISGNGSSWIGDRPAGHFLVNGIAVSTTNHCIGSEPQTVRLEPKVMALLVALASHPHDLVRREQLLEHIWLDGLGGERAQIEEAGQSITVRELVVGFAW